MFTGVSEDFSTVECEGLIVLYDNPLSAPRIIKVSPGRTPEFIESLASQTYEYSHQMGGAVPYTVIREVTENFIHAAFEEVVISVLDGGNTIRFSDQGPGIADKQKARQPGFTSATQAMKHYIRGVGSGLMIVDEFLGITNGVLTIDDNIDHGAVVTISLRKEGAERMGGGITAGQMTVAPTFTETREAPAKPQEELPKLNAREQAVIALLSAEGPLGVKAIADKCDIPLSSTHNLLARLEAAGIIHTPENQKKRALTPYGESLVL